MKIKKGVIMQGLQIEMQPALIEAERIWKSLGEELVITSALDGEHSAGSLHYYGYALDFRTRYFSTSQRRSAFEQLTHALAKESVFFDVIEHSSHIHVEFDF